MTRMVLPLAVLALGLAAWPASGQPTGRPAGRAGPDKGGLDKGGLDKGNPDRRGGPPVIGCPSLANYRMLMHDGAAAAASVLADPKADHLGCNTLSRADLTAIVDHVALGGRTYECAALHGTTICQWVEAGTATRPGPAGSARR